MRLNGGEKQKMRGEKFKYIDMFIQRLGKYGK